MTTPEDAEAAEMARLVEYPHGPLVQCRETGSVVNFPCATDCEMACAPIESIPNA